MECGLKLDPGVLPQGEWQARFGETAELLEQLKGIGVDFIELPWGDDRLWEPVREVVVHCARLELGVSVHPYLHGPLAPEIFDQTGVLPGHEEMLRMCQSFGEQTGGPVTVVFHGGIAAFEPHHRVFGEALHAGRLFFGWLGLQCSERFALVQPMCETQLPHARDNDWITRIGDTWETCLALTADTDVGICWDFGHAFASADLGKHSSVPPDEFVRAVRHIHAHDAIRDKQGGWQDHRPLDAGSCDWRRNFRLLQTVDFRGRVLFEIDLMGFSCLEAVGRMFRFCAQETLSLLAGAPAGEADN